MYTRKEPKFKLPPIRPERLGLNGSTLAKNCEMLISIPRDNVRLDPYLDIIVQRQRKAELSHMLQKKRYHADIFQKKIEMQWKELEQNELAFQHTIVTHNKFLRRNLEKRERALAKIQTDQDIIKKREREIKMLQEKYNFFNAIMIKMRNEIKKNNIYENYLNSVIECDESPYKSDLEFLAKYESLHLIKEQCIVRQNEEMAITVMWHASNVEYFRSQDIVLIGLRNELNNLCCKFDNICRKNLATESIITSIISRTNELNAEVSACQYMIDAIFRYICHRRKLPYMDLSLKEVKPKIDILKSTLEAWEKILHSANIIKNKNRSKTLRKSHMWKRSIAQSDIQWKEKAQSKVSGTEKLENFFRTGHYS